MDKQLDMYEVRVLPYNYAGVHGGIEKTYQITVKVNGEERTVLKGVGAKIPPHLTELEVLNRMTQEILHTLKDEATPPIKGKEHAHE